MRKVLIAATALLLLVIVPGTPARAALAAPGTVLSSATVALPADLATKGTAKRIEYVTTDVNGVRIKATGLILTPKNNRVNKTVVWAHGTTGIADRCTPSLYADVFWPEARKAVLELLKRGWTVAAPDYPGLGTSDPHPYLIGDSEGRAIIDSVRAARNLDGWLSKNYAVDGHSQGGQGALFAGELAPSYDGDLVLKGVAAIAPASNVDLLAPGIPGSGGEGYLVMGVFGLAAVDPSVRPAELFAAPAKEAAKMAKLQNKCLYEILDAFAFLTADQLLVGGALPDSVLAELAERDNPGRRPASAPILVVQGDLDEAVPKDVTDYLVYVQLAEADVQYLELPGRNHDGAVFDSTVQVADWIRDRLNS